MRRLRRKKAERLVLQLAALFDMPLQVSNSATGTRFERYCIRKCRRLGYQVIDDTKKQVAHDIIVNGYRVQCKSRKLHKSRPTTLGLVHTGACLYTVDTVDFFALAAMKTVWIVPSAFLAREDGTIPKDVSTTKIAHFANAWHQLAGDPVYYEKQKGLPFCG